MKNLLDSKTVQLQDIFGNGKAYAIPKFQRDYSWSEENWEDLWNDFLNTKDLIQPHYMGAIVLQNTEKDDHFIVVDGQQRLITMTLFAVAVIKVLQDLIEKQIDEKDNRSRIKEIKRIFLGKKTIATLHYESKLTLNKNNDTFFQHNILRLKKPTSYSKLKDSEKLLWDGYQYFYEQLRSQKFKSGEEITLFLEETVAKKMIFIQISVDNELEAYNLFETLNARGVELTTTDLLKNYLFAISAKNSSTADMNVLEEKWNKLIHDIGLKYFPVFLRFYINSKNSLIRKEQLLKKIKSNIQNNNQVFQLVDELEEKALLYNAIKNPEDDFWNDFPYKIEIIQSLRELKLFGITQPIPLLFALHKHLPDLFHTVLRDMVHISFRYNVIGKRNPNEMEAVYNTVSQKISNGDFNKKEEIYKELEKIYINDEDFKYLFSKKEISTGGKNKKLVKYILTKIENQISETDYDWNDATFTIEHIIPVNYSSEWNAVFDNNVDIDKFIYRMGNYTLLEDKKNRECNNKNYGEKIKIYRTSKYKLTNQYCIKDTWDISALNNYQSIMAKFATSIWKVHF